MQEIKQIDEVLNTKQKKLSFFQNLILVSAADGVFGMDEGNFLIEVGERLGLAAEDVMPIVDNLSYISFIIPEDGLQKTLELQTLVQMMLKDGEIHGSEYALCQDYANRIGFSKTILDEMISQLAGNSQKH